MAHTRVPKNLQEQELRFSAHPAQMMRQLQMIRMTLLPPRIVLYFENLEQLEYSLICDIMQLSEARA